MRSSQETSPKKPTPKALHEEWVSTIPESQAINMLLDPEKNISGFRLEEVKDSWGEGRRPEGKIVGKSFAEGDHRHVDMILLGPSFIGRAVARVKRKEPNVQVHGSSIRL